MTRKKLERYVGVWRRRLRLTHWDLFVDWDEYPVDGANANCTWSYDYDTAILRFGPGWEKWTPLYAETTVVHELLHMVMRDLDVAAEAHHALLSGPARQLAKARHEHEAEGVVDRIASVLVSLAPAGL